MNTKDESIIHHEDELSNPSINPSVTSSASNSLELNVEHLQFLQRTVLRRRWMVVYPLYILLIYFIVVSLDFPRSILLQCIEFAGIVLVSILVVSLVFYYLIRVLLKRSSVDIKRWSAVLKTHKRGNVFLDINVVALVFGIILGALITINIDNIGFPFFLAIISPQKLFLDHLLPNIQFLVLSVLLGLIIAFQQLLGERYPYLSAFYQIKNWYEIREQSETKNIRGLVQGFRDLERHFGIYEFFFGKFGDILVEGIFFLAHFGTIDDQKKFNCYVFTLLNEMQCITHLKIQNYNAIISVIAKIGTQLNDLAFRGYLQRKKSRIDQMMRYLLQPALTGRFIIYLIPLILSTILTIMTASQ